MSRRNRSSKHLPGKGKLPSSSLALLPATTALEDDHPLDPQERPPTASVPSVTSSSGNSQEIESSSSSSFNVLLGRGKGAYESQGNQRLFRLVDDHLLEYTAASNNREKVAITARIVLQIKDSGGRFVSEDAEDGTLHEASDAKARIKVGQLMRHKRRHLLSEKGDDKVVATFAKSPRKEEEEEEYDNDDILSVMDVDDSSYCSLVAWALSPLPEAETGKGMRHTKGSQEEEERACTVSYVSAAAAATASQEMKFEDNIRMEDEANEIAALVDGVPPLATEPEPPFLLGDSDRMELMPLKKVGYSCLDQKLLRKYTAESAPLMMLPDTFSSFGASSIPSDCDSEATETKDEIEQHEGKRPQKSDNRNAKELGDNIRMEPGSREQDVKGYSCLDSKLVWHGGVVMRKLFLTFPQTFPSFGPNSVLSDCDPEATGTKDEEEQLAGKRPQNSDNRNDKEPKANVHMEVEAKEQATVIRGIPPPTIEQEPTFLLGDSDLMAQLSLPELWSREQEESGYSCSYAKLPRQRAAEPAPLLMLPDTFSSFGASSVPSDCDSEAART